MAASPQTVMWEGGRRKEPASGGGVCMSVDGVGLRAADFALESTVFEVSEPAFFGYQGFFQPGSGT